MNPFLSIVIPTYNRAHLIEATIRSVLDQTNRDFEVIIVDDGSTDNTEQVVKSFLSENVRYIRITNSERGAARNRGTEICNGRYINWFDSDDIMLSHHVESVKTIAETNNFPEVITVHYSIRSEDGSQLSEVKREYKSPKKTGFLLEGNYLACNPVIVRRDIALENPFIEDRKLSASEDYELWLRLKAKYSFVSSAEVTSYLIQHPERSVNRMKDALTLETRFLTFINITTSNPEIQRMLGSKLQYFVMRNYLILAVDLAFNGNKKPGFRYLMKGLRSSPAALRQKVFWATIKHLLK